MKKSIGIERTYFLGQFKNIKYSTKVEDIPENLLLNPQFIEALKTSMYLEADRAYFEYMKNSLTVAPEKVSPEEALAMIDEVAVERLENLKQTFAEKKDEKKDENEGEI